MVSSDSWRRGSRLSSRPTYAGVGSRSTPREVCQRMTEIAVFLERKGFVLRSGGATGADAAFEVGVTYPSNKEIYLPWKGFNLNRSDLYGVSQEALDMAAKFHPAWDECGTGARELHARNCYQVLGRDLSTPCRFIVCWTKGGKLVGGTSQALRLANFHSIPVFNLAREKDIAHVTECVRTDQVFA